MRSTMSSMPVYVYILQSEPTGHFYVGQTRSLQNARAATITAMPGLPAVAALGHWFTSSNMPQGAKQFDVNGTSNSRRTDRGLNGC